MQSQISRMTIELSTQEDKGVGEQEWADVWEEFAFKVEKNLQ